MSSNWRRFEVLLPLQFNDGREIPPDWLAEAVLEIVEHFGGSLQGKTIAAEDMPPRNLVFLVDTSGSMDAPNRLPLLKLPISRNNI